MLQLIDRELEARRCVSCREFLPDDFCDFRYVWKLNVLRPLGEYSTYCCDKCKAAEQREQLATANRLWCELIFVQTERGLKRMVRLTYLPYDFEVKRMITRRFNAMQTFVYYWFVDVFGQAWRAEVEYNTRDGETVYYVAYRVDSLPKIGAVK